MVKGPCKYGIFSSLLWQFNPPLTLDGTSYINSCSSLTSDLLSWGLGLCSTIYFLAFSA